jgi:hypothetical protein
LYAAARSRKNISAIPAPSASTAAAAAGGNSSDARAQSSSSICGNAFGRSRRTSRSRLIIKPLCQTFAQMGWRSPPYQEANSLPPEQPHRFRPAFAPQRRASDVKVAELLRISVWQLDHEMAATPTC